MPQKIFDARDVRFAQGVLFQRDSILRIPEYQRPYEWRKNVEAATLWEDLTTREGERLFVGCIIRLEGEKVESEKNGVMYHWNVIELVDGQQRAMTSYILLGALRDTMALKSRNLPSEDAESVLNDIVHEIQQQFFQFKNRKKSNKEDNPFWGYRFEARKSLKTFFEKNILDLVPLDSWNEIKWNAKWVTDANKNEARTIRSNYDFFRGKFMELPLKTSDDFYALRDEFAEHFEALDSVAIDLISQKHKYSVFESINSKGKGLDTSDKVKSCLLNRVKSQTDKNRIYSCWDEIQAISNRLRSFNPKSVLRYHWLANHGHCTMTSLLPSISKKVKTSDEAIEFAVDCVASVKLLHLIQRGSLSDLREHFAGGKSAQYPKTIRSLLKFRNYVLAGGTMQPIQVLLALFPKQSLVLMDDKEVSELVEIFTKFCFAYSSVMDGKGSTMEKAYAASAKALASAHSGNSLKESRKAALASTEGLQIDLIKAWPSEASLREKIEKWKYLKSKNKNNYRIRTALLMLEEHTDPGGFSEVEFQNVSVEHVSPQNPDFTDKHWDKKDVLGHERIKKSRYINALGNLTLLGTSLNSSIKALPPRKKFEHQAFISSKYSLNKKIREQILGGTNWNLAFVKRRDKSVRDDLAKILQPPK